MHATASIRSSSRLGTFPARGNASGQCPARASGKLGCGHSGQHFTKVEVCEFGHALKKRLTPDNFVYRHEGHSFEGASLLLNALLASLSSACALTEGRSFRGRMFEHSDSVAGRGVLYIYSGGGGGHWGTRDWAPFQIGRRAVHPTCA